MVYPSLVLISAYEVDSSSDPNCGSHPHTQAKGYDVEHIGKELGQRMHNEGQSPWQYPHEDGSEWEEDNEGEGSDDSMR
jgi:hypothetical protein